MSFSYTRRYTGPIRAVVFDWAGTMVDHGCQAPTAVFQAAFATAGLPITEAEARGPMGRAKIDHIRDIGAMETVAARWEQTKGRAFTEEDVAEIYATFLPRQIAVAGDHADLIPGAAETAGWLRGRGVRLGSTTGYTREIMAAVTPKAAAAGYAPDCLICAGDLPKGRPAPHMLWQAMMALDTYPPAAVVKVGDTVTDIDEGLNAGTWTVGCVETGSNMGLTLGALTALPAAERVARRAAAAEPLARAGAHYLIDGVADLPSVIEDIEGRLRRGDTP